LFKRIANVLLLLLCSMGVQAGPPKNQFFVAYGLLDVVYLRQLVEVFQATPDNLSLHGPVGQIFIEYKYRKNDVAFGFSAFTREFSYSRTTTDGILRDHYDKQFSGLVFQVDYFWLNGPYRTLSSQLGLGLRYWREQYNSDINNPYKTQQMAPAIQFTPILMTFGNHLWHARMDMGIGHRAFVGLGLGVQF
jgi:hypothetical protein